MKTIFITISRGMLIRNFFQTGIVGRLLEHGFRVIILASDSIDRKLFEPFSHNELIIEPLFESKIRFMRFFEEMFKGAIFNKEVRVRYKYRGSGKLAPNKFFYILRLILLTPLNIIPYFKKFICSVDFFVNPQKEHDYLFEKYKPDFVFTTAVAYLSDVGVIKSARRFMVPCAINPKSWDNITGKLFPIKADYLFVWSEYMKEKALLLQGYSSDKIIITGVPQFDFYQNESLRMSREEFCNFFGLDPKKKIILYASSGGGDLCDEMQFISFINSLIEKGTIKESMILVRPHLSYKNDLDRYAPCEKYKLCVLDRTAKQNLSLKDLWDVSDGHVRILSNSLFHADVCINIASTFTLDAIASGKQVININYDRNQDVDINYSVKRLHFLGYIKSVTSCDATWMARSDEDLTDALIGVLEHGYKKNYNEFIERFMYKNDGKSGQRIADEIIKIIESK
jgi:hypothetical protein